MSEIGRKGGGSIFQKCLKFKNVPNVGGGGGSTLIGTLSQIFSLFFSDASPNNSFNKVPAKEYIFSTLLPQPAIPAYIDTTLFLTFITVKWLTQIGWNCHTRLHHGQGAQCTEKVLGVRILAFSQIRSEKGIPFWVKEEFSSMLNVLHLRKVILAVLYIWRDSVTKIKFFS